MPNVLIEGYTLDEILELPDDLLASYVFTNEPVVFRVGSAEILGSFRLKDKRLIIELAQIEGGGEGVLPTLWILANLYAAQHDLIEVEWIVHAVTCARPNLKLRRVLERRGFTVQKLEEVGEVYHFIQVV